ncbi:hypothetical protein T484DRAFT_1748023 [Baffinella frigidus]|nr:hypothetical protein T484DRAFT_1748023 [Cryptophyta sp. CCMP2293]
MALRANVSRNAMAPFGKGARHTGHPRGPVETCANSTRHSVQNECPQELSVVGLKSQDRHTGHCRAARIACSLGACCCSSSRGLPAGGCGSWELPSRWPRTSGGAPPFPLRRKTPAPGWSGLVERVWQLRRALQETIIKIEQFTTKIELRRRRRVIIAVAPWRTATASARRVPPVVSYASGASG